MTEDSARRYRTMPDLLLVEDNPLHLRLVKSMLADIWPPNEVAEVRHARSLEEAIAEIDRQPPECVLLDLVLPDADGIDTLDGVRAADPLVPIVVLSSHENSEMARNAITSGAQDYLVKGAVSPDDLERSVAFAMGRKDHERKKVAETPGITPWPVNQPDTATAPAEGSTSAPPAASAPLGLAVVDAGGSVLFVEPAVALGIGRSINETIETPLDQLIHPNDLTAWNKLLAGDPGPVDVRYMHPSGHPIYLRVIASHMEGGIDGGAMVATYFARGEVGTVSSGAYVEMSDWG